MRASRFLVGTGSGVMTLGVAVASIAAARASADARLLEITWFQIGAVLAVGGMVLYLIGHVGALLSPEDSRPVTVQGGAGGPGGAGGIGDVVYGGHGGGGGGAAHGPGSRAEGGTGGESGGPSAFEQLARASLGMGYPLDEFLRLTGFDPYGPEIDQIGRGGDADQPRGPGLVVLSYVRADGRKEVSVHHADGRQMTITATSPPGSAEAL